MSSSASVASAATPRAAARSAPVASAADDSSLEDASAAAGAWLFSTGLSFGVAEGSVSERGSSVAGVAGSSAVAPVAGDVASGVGAPAGTWASSVAPSAVAGTVVGSVASAAGSIAPARAGERLSASTRERAAQAAVFMRELRAMAYLTGSGVVHSCTEYTRRVRWRLLLDETL